MNMSMSILHLSGLDGLLTAEMFSMVVSAILALAVINMVLWGVIHEKGFAYAATFLFVQAFLLVLVVDDGFFSNLTVVRDVGADYLPAAIIGMLAAFTMQSKTFLGVSQYEPRTSRWMWGVFFSGVALGAVSVASFTLPVLAIGGYAVLVLATTLVAGAVRLQDGFPPAYVFVGTWIVTLGLMAVTLVPAATDVLGGNAAIILTSSALLQAFLITCGVIYRVAVMHRQVVHYKESLEKAVSKRTDELEAMAGELQESNEALTLASRTDPLTGCANRRAFDESAKRIFSNASRERSEVSLLVVDADFFKRINDNYGHDVGDLALKHMAQALTECVRRPLDLTARFGGEEFVILLNSTGLRGAERVAAEVSKWLKEHPLETAGESITITLSTGVVSGCPVDDGDVERYFKQADDLVYVAKNNGRDQFHSKQMVSNIRRIKAPGH
jgi:diguanylate cyclase (GGDEF)-like protein